MSEVATVKTGIFSTFEELEGPVDVKITEPVVESADSSETPQTDKDKLENILALLDEARLNLKDTSGQGFLFNAQHQIIAYLNTR